jgi:hypothetical protein
MEAVGASETLVLTLVVYKTSMQITGVRILLTGVFVGLFNVR